MSTVTAPRPSELKDTRDVPLSQIVLAKYNNRSLPNPEADQALAASLKLHGQLQPAVGRELPSGEIEIVNGSRRFRAAKAAKLATLRVEIRELTDDEAHVIMLIENLQRQGLHPLEEAQGLADLMKLAEIKSIAEAARRVGMEPGVAARRMKLLDLSEPWKAILLNRDYELDGIDESEVNVEIEEKLPQLLTSAHLQQIARLPTHQQNTVLRELISYDSYDTLRTLNLEEFKRLISNFLKNLDGAPFNPADETLLPEAGPCTTCPKRARANDVLFDDLEIAEAGACLDEECYRAKLKAYLDRRAKEAEEKLGRKLAIVPTHSTSDIAPKAITTMLNHWQIEKAKKSDPKALPVLKLDGPKAGTIEWVKPSKGATTAVQAQLATGKAAAAAAASKDDKAAKAPTLKEKLAKIENRRRAHIIQAVQKWLRDVVGGYHSYYTKKQNADAHVAAAAVLKRINSTTHNLLAIVLTFGTSYRAENRGTGFSDQWKDLAELQSNLTQASERAIIAVATVLANRLDYSQAADVPKVWPELERIAELLQIDLAPYRKAANEAIPIPKSYGVSVDEAGEPLLTKPKGKGNEKKTSQAKQAARRQAPAKKGARPTTKAKAARRRKKNANA